MLTPAERLLALRLRRELRRLDPQAFGKRPSSPPEPVMELACQAAMKETGITAEHVQDFVERFSYGDLHGNRFIEFLNSVE